MKRTVLTLLLALTSSAFAGLDEGKAALEAGNYPLAETEFATVSSPQKLYWRAQIWLKRRSSLEDIVDARRYLQDAAQVGYAPAMTALGESYNRIENFGSGEAAGYLETEGKKVFDWFKKAAQAGDPEGMYRLAAWYDGINDAASAAKNMVLALEWYKKAAALGNGAALYQMGVFYLEGVRVPKDPAQTQTLWTQAVKVGDTDAMIALAQQYEGGKSDAALEQSLTLYLKAAEVGDVRGMGKMGRAYLSGVFGGGTLTKNLPQALRWLEAAAAAGDGDAGYEAGVIYARGVGVKQDLERAEKLLGNMTDSGLGFTVYARILEGDFQDFVSALYWYGKAAGPLPPDPADPDSFGADAEEQSAEGVGDPDAQKALVRLYLSKKPGVPYDPAFALRWAEVVLRRANRDPDQAFLASLFVQGLGTAKDLDKVLEPYRNVARAGDNEDFMAFIVLVQYALGQSFERGQGREKDLDQALELYQNAARAGNKKDYLADAIARVQYALAKSFDYGEGRTQDYAKAASLYRQAAEGGQMDAAAQLGYFYFTGRGVPKDDKQAVSWSRIAAGQGNAKGLFNLGLAFELGQGVVKDLKQALELYLRAAALGSASAQGALGALYFNGVAVPQDLKRAADWFGKGAEGGDRGAQYNLGVCYENDWGVTQDLELARLWYGKAAAQGQTQARDALARLGVTKP